jgi:hypothetical protein
LGGRFPWMNPEAWCAPDVAREDVRSGLPMRRNYARHVS